MDWARKIAFNYNAPNTGENRGNYCKSIDLVIRIELTQAILMPRFSNFLRNSTVHFLMFLCLETCFPRVTDLLLWRLQAVSKIHVPFLSRNLIMWRETKLFDLVTGTATKPRLGKHVTKYENKWKWMVEFLRKFENRGIKIGIVNSICITKSINLQLFTLFLSGFEGPLLCWHL